MRKVILYLIGSCIYLLSNAQNISYTKEDSAQCVRYLKVLQYDHQISFSEKIIQAARLFLGKPYVTATLEQEPEQVIVNLQQLDCTTFIETVLALSIESQQVHPTFDGFIQQLRLLRYRNGNVSYINRLHYLSDWLSENQKRGILEDQTPLLNGNTPLKLNLSFMSSHTDAYPILKANPQLISQIEEIESAINQRNSYAYLPKKNVKAAVRSIRNGDIIAFVTTIKGLDVTHVGIAYWENPDKLTFIHASSISKKVIINPEPMTDYLTKQYKCKGIWVIRPL